MFPLGEKKYESIISSNNKSNLVNFVKVKASIKTSTFKSHHLFNQYSKLCLSVILQLQVDMHSSFPWILCLFYFYHTGTCLTATPKLGLISFTRSAATNLLLGVQLPLKIWPHVFIISAPSELSNGSKTFFFFSVLLGSFAFATNLVFTFINCFIN